MTHRFALAAAVLAAAAAPGRADIVYGLTTFNQLLAFDTTTGVTAAPVDITGTTGDEAIIDIDFYPVNNLLYGLAGDGDLYRIDTATGVATLDVSPSSAIAGATEIDFNPAVDRLRVYAGNSNFRLTPGDPRTPPAPGGPAGNVSVDGTLAYVGSDVGLNGSLVAAGAAYTNNVDGTAATTLYTVDSGNNVLAVNSVGPQFNALTSVGEFTLGGSAFAVDGPTVGFDISDLGTAYLASGNGLFTLNVATAELTSVGAFSGGTVTGIAVAAVPEPGSLALVAAAVVGPVAARVRRRKAAAG